VCLLGFLLSLGFNALRAALLAWLAATQGSTAVTVWHDPAGVALLVTCFGCVWLLAKGLALDNKAQDSGQEASGTRKPARDEQWASPGPKANSYFRALALLLWILVAELATRMWYRAHELSLPPALTWTIELPREQPGFREDRLSAEARKLLRFDHCQAGFWQTAGGAGCQAIFLQWNPGRAAAFLAAVHSPGNCLAAAGQRCVEESQLGPLWNDGLRLAFRSYSFRVPTGPVYVFYTLWRDRAGAQDFAASAVSCCTRIEAVFSGRRNCGQRSLEFAVWGTADQTEAERVFTNELRSIIRVHR
jgi:hypothetical protein